MQWANFVDKTKDINATGNYIQGSLQSEKPDSEQVGDYWLQNHPNWLQVDDGFVPPVPALTKDQQYTAINTKYDSLKASLLTTISYDDSIALTSASTICKAKIVSNEVLRKAELLAVSKT